MALTDPPYNEFIVGGVGKNDGQTHTKYCLVDLLLASINNSVYLIVEFPTKTSKIR